MKIIKMAYGTGNRFVWYVHNEGSFIAGPYKARDEAAIFIRNNKKEQTK